MGAGTKTYKVKINDTSSENKRGKVQISIEIFYL